MKKEMAFGWDDAAKIAAPVLGLAAGIGAGKRQIKQQKKLNELGIDAYRQQTKHNDAIWKCGTLQTTNSNVRTWKTQV